MHFAFAFYQEWFFFLNLLILCTQEGVFFGFSEPQEPAPDAEASRLSEAEGSQRKSSKDSVLFFELSSDVLNPPILFFFPDFRKRIFRSLLFHLSRVWGTQPISRS